MVRVLTHKKILLLGLVFLFFIVIILNIPYVSSSLNSNDNRNLLAYRNLWPLVISEDNVYLRIFSSTIENPVPSALISNIEKDNNNNNVMIIFDSTIVSPPDIVLNDIHSYSFSDESVTFYFSEDGETKTLTYFVNEDGNFYYDPEKQISELPEIRPFDTTIEGYRGGDVGGTEGTLVDGGSGDDNGTGDDDGSGDDNGTGDDDGSGDDNGTGDDDDSGDDNGTGDDDDSGDDNGTGDDDGSGDDNGTGDDDGSGDDNGTGDDDEEGTDDKNAKIVQKYDELLDEGWKELDEDQLKELVNEKLNDVKGRLTSLAFTDFARRLFAPTIGEITISNWFSKLIGKDPAQRKKELYEQNSDSWKLFVFDFEYAMYSQVVCQNLQSGFFEPIAYASVGKGGSYGLENPNFIYGKKIKNRHHDDGYFLNENNEELGLIYTISWQIKHPYTREELNMMTNSEKVSKGLTPNAGNIVYAVFFELENGQITHGKYRALRANSTGALTASFYTKDKIKNVYLGFFEGYKHNGYDKFPQNGICNSNTNIGCIIEDEGTSLSGGSVNFPNEDEESGSGIPVAINIYPSGSSPSSSVGSDGHYGGNV